MKKLFWVLLVVVTMVSCNSNTFKINVNLENSNGKTVYLQRYDNGKMVKLDSVVAKNNIAVFKVQQSENNDAYCIMMKSWRRPLTFFADNQDVTISGDCQNYNGINVLASVSQEKLNHFTSDVNDIEDEQKMYYYVIDFVKQNIENPLGAYVAYRYKWLFDLDTLKNILKHMPEDMQSGYKAELEQYVENLKKSSPGNPYIDFTQDDVNGKPFTFSSVIGKSKVIILDFWASWCPDCRKANPELVEIYNQYKDKGLDIVSVSLDTDKERWIDAIKEDNLSWKNHVSDLKGWSNSVAGLYTVAFIPQTFVIDENGEIVGRNMPMEKLQAYLADILK